MDADDVRKLRQGLGLTMEELGRRLGVTQAEVIRWERGETFPTKAHVDAMAAISRGEDPPARGPGRRDAGGSITSPLFRDPRWASVLRKFLYYPELRAEVWAAAERFKDPGDAG